MKSIGKSLYHYTDFNALNSILTNRELRVNNVLNMNDAAEMLYFMTELSNAVIERLEKTGHPEHIETIKKMFQWDEKKEFTHSAYAACFSRSRDDASQWERYGNSGRGVCVAFCTEKLERMAGGPLSLQPVFYHGYVKDHELVDLFCSLAEKNQLGPEHPKVQQAMEQAWICSAAFKHPSFVSESEVRLVVSPFVDECFGIKPQYHVSANRIKKYYPLNLDTMCRNIGAKLEDVIDEMIIGPESTQSLPILQDYLVDHGYSELAYRVRYSQCPLRHSPEKVMMLH